MSESVKARQDLHVLVALDPVLSRLPLRFPQLLLRLMMLNKMNKLPSRSMRLALAKLPRWHQIMTVKIRQALCLLRNQMLTLKL